MPSRSRTASILSLLALMFFASACGRGGDDNSTTPAQDMQAGEDMSDMSPVTADMSPDLGKEDMSMRMTCQDETLTACGQLCTDVQTDINHCGECFYACGRGSSCLDGECLCLSTGQTWCGQGTCVKTDSDPMNCGFCGNKCPEGSSMCINGACSCEGGSLEICGDVCADKSKDRKNCGSCGNECSDVAYCRNGTCTGDDFFDEVIALTNIARETARMCGDEFKGAVPPLGQNDILAAAAQKHALDMAERDYFAHESPEGISPHQRILAEGYQGRATGENIAYGQQSPQEVVQGWIDSPGHCVNIMSPLFNEIGIGYTRNADGRPYWVQNFGLN